MAHERPMPDLSQCTGISSSKIPQVIVFLLRETLILFIFFLVTIATAVCFVMVTTVLWMPLIKLVGAIFCVAGVLRNMSSACESARSLMRNTYGMVDTLMWLVKAGVQQKSAAN